MSQTASVDAQFQQQFSTPLSFALSSPPPNPQLTSSPTIETSCIPFGERPPRARTGREQQQPITVAASGSAYRATSSSGKQLRSIQPLVVSPALIRLNEPWGAKPPRTKAYAQSTLSNRRRVLLEELLCRYGRDPVEIQGRKQSELTHDIAQLESQMSKTIDRAHLLIPGEYLQGPQRPIRFGPEPMRTGQWKFINRGPGLENHRPILDATADLNEMPTEPSSATSHENGEMQVFFDALASYLQFPPPEIDPQESMLTTGSLPGPYRQSHEINESAPQEFISNMGGSPPAPHWQYPSPDGVSQEFMLTSGSLPAPYPESPEITEITRQEFESNMGGSLPAPHWQFPPSEIALQEFGSNMMPQSPQFSQMGPATSNMTAADALANLSESLATTTEPFSTTMNLQMPLGECAGYLCCQCKAFSAKELDLTICHRCVHLICQEGCLPI
ncbi:hypothetical protein K505DRAFT_362928 [Melanomma pulvis-pyrius CBS 109.77]|uniref:Uncharacterized protein n=1 Tax=Melanomma pulvis-pyrius CBS 109.77 TaxID=1314802 RepID=A0A6A6X7T3_9PLEO|nr:hypothetical protein K505DRAFT_362928 [Melanomma pulvis-pyrius CBS 109.77]